MDGKAGPRRQEPAMFKRNKPDAAPAVPTDRVNSIVAKAPPADYADVGGRGARAKRQPVFKQALAILPHGEKVQIAIKSMSATGLRIEYFQNRPLPPAMIISEASIPLHVRAELVWQGEGAAGLRIIRPPTDED